MDRSVQIPAGDLRDHAEPAWPRAVLAFQFAIDLNYSELIDHQEAEFVVARPGSIDGIAKCFGDVDGVSPEQVIYWVCDRQEREFSDRGIDSLGLFGRRLQPIDCQNVFCEISKYARVAHPEVEGPSRGKRIKQLYVDADGSLPTPVFPPSWRLKVSDGLGGRETAPLLL